LGNDQYLKSPLEPNFWRPETDNDRLTGVADRLRIWEKAAINRILSSFKIEPQPDRSLLVVTNFELPDVKGYFDAEYLVRGDGSILINIKLTKGNGVPEVVRVGMVAKLPEKFDRIEWYGRGPHESYEDKKSGAAIGLYTASVKNDFFLYPQPQESSNKVDVRWLAITDKKGRGFKVSGSVPLSISAVPFDLRTLQDATHINELPMASGYVSLYIDYKQMGVGGDNSWDVKGEPHSEFMLGDQKYSYSFTIVPVN
jgi:beta-galactosidase